VFTIYVNTTQSDLATTAFFFGPMREVLGNLGLLAEEDSERASNATAAIVAR
jgi:hypothetical protein